MEIGKLTPSTGTLTVVKDGLGIEALIADNVMSNPGG